MEILNKALFGASLLLATLSMSIQVKAATYDISQVGSASITSITNTAGTVTYDATNLVATTSTTVNFNFAGVINDMSSLQAGDKITIPMTFNGHFASSNTTATSSLSFSSSVTYLGQTIFNVSVSNSPATNTDVITLTVTTAGAALSGEVDFNLVGQSNLSVSGSMATYLADSTVYTINGNNYTLGNQHYVFTSSNSCKTRSTQSTNTTSSRNVVITGYYIYCLYNELLAGTLDLTDPTLTDSNVVTVATIPANANILSVDWYQSPATLFAFYVMPDGSNMISSSSPRLFTSPTFTNGAIPPNATMTQIEAALQPGQHAIVQNSDGSYTIAINWGPLVGSTYNEYPAGSSIADYDSASNALLQQAILNKLSATEDRQYVTINYVDPTVSNTATLSTVSNIPTLLGNSSVTVSTIPVNNAAAGQTVIKIHYVDLSGKDIAAVKTTPYGWPSDNTMNQQPTPAIQITDSVIAGYTQVTNATIYDTMTSIPTSQILYSDTSISYPLTAVGTAVYYYVYAPIATQDLPITGLQLNARIQGNNDVLLTWGTITEINSKSFTVQRSADNGKTWVNVGSLPTQAQNGNSSVPLTYQLSDQYVPVGNYEYRVVETDINGSTTMSNVVPIQITAGAKIYPIPASTYLRIILPAGVNSVPYRMISTDGKVVLQGSMSNQGNFGQISVSGLASAVYFLQVTVNNAVQTYKVQVQH